MNKGKWYYTKSCKHVKNHVKNHFELTSHSCQTITQQIANGIVGKKVKRVRYFAIVLHMLQQGRPMFEYESMKVLFMFLVVPRNKKNH
jgi:hypothetical protein